MPSKDLQRLSTFAQWPIEPSDACSGISNFVSKAAGAYFERTADCVKDEVVCQSCAIQFYDWSIDSSECKLYESPAAVHRVISPKCPALNPSDEDTITMQLDGSVIDWNSLLENPFAKYLPSSIQANSATPDRSPHPSYSETGARVRRVLFPESPATASQQDQEDDHQDPASDTQNQNAATSDSVPQPRVLDQRPITHPVKPKSGKYDHLFASQRLQTFPQPITCTKYQTWAEEGFIFRREQQDVMCVYCGTVLVLNGHQPGVVHRKVCPSCPFVMGFDVGNISQQQEKCIRLVYFKQQAARKHNTDFLMGMKYVQYQKDEDRLGTFQGWPKMCARIFPSDVMVSAGFFYSGYSDKVTCYNCGVELYDWSEEADVWITHATVSPTCLHVINVKGQDFIAQAANLQVLAEVKHPKDSSPGNISSSDGAVEEEAVGSPVLDVAAVKAALACGYTLLQIQHAIVKFFCQTSRYPNEAILKASLKAADENHITICKQQQVVLQTYTQLQQKDTQLQQTYTQLEQKDTQLEQKDTQLEQKDTQLQQTYTQLEQKDTQLEQTYTQLEQKDTQLEQKDTQLEQKDTQLEQTYTVLQEKDTQLQTMRQENEQTMQTLTEQLSEKDEQLNEKEEQLSVKEELLNEKEEQLRWQDRQIQSLLQQVQRLRADHQQRPELAPGPRGDGRAANARAGPNEEARHSLVCKICMMDKPRMIFLPCGHLFSCAECTSRLPDKRCPVCRQDISQVLPAFVA